ncbi:MAG: extracellular solute-binding protein [Spirochaetaceae bacterium]|nr:extracellular solute-binding protein [Spirochaetaceae bacterium]
MKKGLSLVAVAMVAMASAFSQGSSESSSSPVAQTSKLPASIDVWCINNPNESIIKAYDDVGATFEAKTGVKVNYIRTPTNDFHTKLVTSISAGVFPDVIIWNSSPGIEFSSTGKVVPMDDVVDEIGRTEFSEGTLKMFTVGGKLLEAPFMVRPAGIHARKDWLDAAGYDTTLKTDINGKYFIDGIQTWDDLIEAGKKITDSSNGKYGLGFGYSRKAFGDSAGFVFSVYASYGAKIIDEKGNICIDSPEMRSVINFLRRMWESGAVPPSATTWDGNSNNNYFIGGDIGMCLNSNSIMGKLNETTGCKPGNLLMIPMPKGPNGSYVEASPESITVFNTKNVTGAKEFAKYLLQTDTQVEMFKTMGFGYYSPLKKSTAADSLFANLSDNQKVLMQDSLNAVGPSFPGEPNAKLSALYSAFFFDDILSHIAVDNWTDDQIIADMEKKAKETLFD